MAAPVPLRAGDRVRFTHLVSEAEVYLFAAVTGDSHEDHVDATCTVARRYGRIAHGAYLLSLMASASSLIHDRHDVPNVSAGYDRVRFIHPVPIGTQVQVSYVVDQVDERRGRAEAAIEITDEAGTVLAVARHLIAFLDRQGAPRTRGGDDDR